MPPSEGLLHRPSRGGVGASRVGLPPGHWSSVLDFLCERFPRIVRDEWVLRMRRGHILDDAGAPVDIDRPYSAGGGLSYFREVPVEPVFPLDETLLYRDAEIAVVDKPHGLPVVPAGRHLHETLLARLRLRLGNDAAVPLHRIDRDTAGLVLFSLNPATRGVWHALFREGRIEKGYEAIAPCRRGLDLPLTRRSRLETSPELFMQMREVPGEPNAETMISSVERRGGWGRYELRPVTGQRHQLRVHLAALGLPIANDRIYPTLWPDAADDPAARLLELQHPLQLIARCLSFTDPVTDEPRHFESLQRLDLADFCGRALDDGSGAGAGVAAGQREV